MGSPVSFAAPGVIARIRELETEAERRSGAGKAPFEHQIAHGRSLLESDHGEPGTERFCQ